MVELIKTISIKVFHHRKPGRMNKLRFIFFLILWFCLLSHPSWAKKVYVADKLKINLRTGPSIENKIIAMLTSGQSLEVINTQGDWNLVRLLNKDGKHKEGWVLSRYLGVCRSCWCCVPLRVSDIFTLCLSIQDFLLKWSQNESIFDPIASWKGLLFVLV